MKNNKDKNCSHKNQIEASIKGNSNREYDNSKFSSEIMVDMNYFTINPAQTDKVGNTKEGEFVVKDLGMGSNRKSVEFLKTTADDTTTTTYSVKVFKKRSYSLPSQFRTDNRRCSTTYNPILNIYHRTLSTPSELGIIGSVVRQLETNAGDTGVKPSITGVPNPALESESTKGITTKNSTIEGCTLKTLDSKHRLSQSNGCGRRKGPKIIKPVARPPKPLVTKSNMRTKQ